MTDHGIVKSTVKPEPIKLDEYSVYVNTDIQPIEEEVEGKVFIEYSYHMIQYDKDEYLKMQIAVNAELEEQITNTQLALCELYENMEV